uniref:Uncharacterized protein n=1 Tax=Amphimedon queenslandica TaxID=400682 RepID=A0A1X7TXA1_AMPQE
YTNFIMADDAGPLPPPMVARRYNLSLGTGKDAVIGAIQIVMGPVQKVTGPDHKRPGRIEFKKGGV